MVLGNALRSRRNSLGLKQEEVARYLEGSPSKVSRIENGQHQFKECDLRRLFTIYEVDDPLEQAQLRELAEEANREPWWQPWSSVTQKHLQAVVSFESMAQRIKVFEPLQLPGLLQTEAYAHAVIQGGSGDARQHRALAAFRMERQLRFRQAPADKKLICIIDEGSLRRRYGTPEIMREQVRHLIDLATSPRYQIRIAEQDRYNLPVFINSTTIWDFSTRILPTIAYAETFEGGLIFQDEEQVDERIKKFDALRNQSLSPARSVQRLRDLLKSNCYR
ncbi:helix-turn-helix domain-containing protein [Streptomyces sp. 205]|uniref:Helix-turn-helix domain-containing protein n=2 Tax=Streptomyces coffeae TaxID=621382 RepID=A0ABS1NHB2_9ACTN|nr:helix-turn-helix domain-containing protein [Streptomyces coffeae]